MTLEKIERLERTEANLEKAYKKGNADDIIAFANSITRQLGGTPTFNNVEEFRQQLRSETVFEL